MAQPHQTSPILAYEESGSGDQTLILLHGCGLDRHSLGEQVTHFATDYRVISPDLRGHGESLPLGGPYDLDTLAEDVARLCRHLQVSRCVLVGHSMGGNVALSLQHRHPELVSAVLLLDTALFIPEGAKQQIKIDFEANSSSERLVTYYKNVLKSLCLPHEVRTLRLLDDLSINTDMLRSILSQMANYPSAHIIKNCKVPLGYIHSNMPLFDLVPFQELCPRLMYAQTLGSGHFAPLDVPAQVNAMMDTFLSVVNHSPGKR